MSTSTRKAGSAKRKGRLSAVLLAFGLLLVLPGVASAGEWTLDSVAGDKFSVTKVNSTVLRAQLAATVTCTGLSGEGEYSTSTTGTIGLDLTGCTESSFGTKCQSGETSGTISMKSKVFHNVIIGSPGGAFEGGDENTPVGVLITGNSGGSTDLMSFTCGFGLLSVTVTGNVIGEVESPGCGSPRTTFNLNFEPASAGSSTQKYRQVTTTGTEFTLLSHVNEEKNRFTSLSTTFQIHLLGVFARTPTCQ